MLNEDLVNLPNWLVLQLRIEGGDAIRLADVDLLGYRHELDIRYATVVRHVRFRDRSGRETTLQQPPVRQHGRRAPRGDRVDARAGELVGARRGGHGDRRPGEQWRCRPLPAAGGPPPEPRFPTDVRARGHRAEGRDPAVESVHQPGGPHPRVRRRSTAPGRAEAVPDGGLYPAGPGLRGAAGRRRRGSRRWWRSTPRGTRRSATRWCRAATSAARHADFAAAFERHTAAWDELWRVCDMRVSGNEQRAAAAAAAHRARPPGLLRVTPPTSTPGCPPADSTARPTAGTCSGTRSMRSRSSTSGCPRSRAGC